MDDDSTLPPTPTDAPTDPAPPEGGTPDIRAYPTRADRDIPPAELRALARERSRARRERRYADADAIREVIEAEGWSVVDRGSEARLVRSHPVDVVDVDGQPRYGWSGAVPCAALGEPTEVTLVVTARPDAAVTASLVARLRDVAGDARILVVAGDERPVPEISADVVRVRGSVGPGTLLAVARRAVGGGLLVMADVWPSDADRDALDRLVHALDDPAVAVAGFTGRRSDDLRRFEDADSGRPVEAVGWSGLTCRVEDARAVEDLDERFGDAQMFAAWWSLCLRDAGPGGAHRGAVGTRAPGDVVVREDHATRRDRYRLIDRFAGRTDLLLEDTP